MKLLPVINRLKSQVSTLQVVGTASDMLSDIRQSVVLTPAAYVVPLIQTASENQLMTGVSQDMTFRFGIMTVAASNNSGTTGAPASDELDTTRWDIKQAIVGWRPPADGSRNFSKIVYAGGELDATTDKLIVFLDEYETNFCLRK